MEMIRIGVIGMTGVFIAILIKQVHPEYSFAVTLVVEAIILFFAVGKLGYLLETLRKIQDYLPIESTYMNLLLKMIGITFVGQFSAGICRDAGYSAMASQIETFGRLTVLALGMPMVTALLETIYEYLG